MRHRTKSRTAIRNVAYPCGYSYAVTSGQSLWLHVVVLQ